MAATATWLEAIGDGSDELEITHTHLLADDRHSPAADDGFRAAPLTHDAYSCERWLRVRFTPPFETVMSLRFWMPTPIPAGWNLRWGTADAFRRPTTTASSVATQPVPTIDPGAGNCGGEQKLTGDDVRYSDWIVLQAQADEATVAAGALGRDPNGRLNPLRCAFTWREVS